MSIHPLNLFSLPAHGPKHGPTYGPTHGSQIGVGRRLLEAGDITTEQLFFARTRLGRWDAPLTDILVSEGWITEDQAIKAIAAEYHCEIIDLDRAPPDPRLAHVLPPETRLRYGAIPWVRKSQELVIVTSRPESFEQVRKALSHRDSGLKMALALPSQIQQKLSHLHQDALAHACEHRVAPEFSCRNWSRKLLLRLISGLGCAGLACAALALAPKIVAMSLLLVTLAFLMIGATMKLAALAASRSKTLSPPQDTHPATLPKISVLVPLFKETEIANALIRRLTALSYPPALLDVVLILEEKDRLTHETIAQTQLPDWIRVVTVPKGSGLTTKPRAMNYALDFCKGDIIGIWDAEDAPAPNQLETIAAHFATAAEDVACVQGVLDYYNPDTNWISRCFTLEYAMWFRIVLRGMSAMGAPIPLGGTTLFMRRDVLEDIGRWDAHNVTEDADLGIRLARFGYRTELSRTVTQEEANCRFKPWIRQRSRWLKGYMVTYLVHMRRPGRLLQELGWGRFLGLNVILLAALMQFILAPVLWCFWLLMLGVPDPLGLAVMPPQLIGAAMGILGLATVTDLALASISMRGQNRRRLMPWALAFLLYFPMATLAAYKALIELVFIPFYWDKTAHGQTQEGKSAQFSAIST